MKSERAEAYINANEMDAAYLEIRMVADGQ